MKHCFKLNILGTALVLFTTSCSINTSDNRDQNSTNFMHKTWKLDSRYILSRGPEGSFDFRVVGDPCIVWDEEINTWRMFYFASGSNGSTTGIAVSKSAEDIGPGDWEKLGEIEYTNPEARLHPRHAHKFWVVMDPYKPNRASKIDGKYWGIFTVSTPNKHLQVASADKLSGPWTIREKPILSPDENFFDGRHCDTPSAYWFEDKNYVAIFYKGYPKNSQRLSQPGSPYGSGTILAYWHPNDEVAEKVTVLMRPGQTDAWNQGWFSTPMIFYDEKNEYWYALINGSPTPPEDDSHREPAPCLGGWVICKGDWIDTGWQPDTDNSPFMHVDDLSEAERNAGLGVNFWRHHLLVTPKGQVRIFFNSGPYGKEQMYSFVADGPVVRAGAK
jgi:hypothetical protein